MRSQVVELETKLNGQLKAKIAETIITCKMNIF